MEKQDWNVPGSLMNRMYAAFLTGIDFYEASDLLVIPAKHIFPIMEMWESWEQELEENPHLLNVAQDVPHEFPDID